MEDFEFQVSHSRSYFSSTSIAWQCYSSLSSFVGPFGRFRDRVGCSKIYRPLILQSLPLTSNPQIPVNLFRMIVPGNVSKFFLLFLKLNLFSKVTNFSPNQHFLHVEKSPIFSSSILNSWNEFIHIMKRWQLFY